MRVDDVLKLSTRMFRTNFSRTALTILGMGVGTAAVVILVGLGFGLQKIILEQIVFGETLLSLNVTNPSGRSVVLSREQVDNFSKINYVEAVAPLASLPAIITFGQISSNITLQGANPEYFRYAGWQMAAGSTFNDKNLAADNDKIILSLGALKLFGIKDPEDVFRKKVRLRVFVGVEGGGAEVQEVALAKEYEIKGIINEPAAMMAILTLEEFESQFRVPFYERAQVKVVSSKMLGDVQEEILKKGFMVTALSKTVEQANKIFQGLQAILAAFGGIALVVSAIGMFNTMTVTLLERTNEIGIMRTIGASPRDINILFLTEAVIMGFLGGIVGILMGLATGYALNLTVKTAASYFGGTTTALFVFPILFLLFIAAFSAIVGFLTGLFPARRASILNPLDAIRYK